SAESTSTESMSTESTSAESTNSDSTSTAVASAEATAAADGDTTVDLDYEPHPKFGPWGAKALEGGAAPSDAFTIKGNVNSMLYHTTASPYYRRTVAQVWFRTE